MVFVFLVFMIMGIGLVIDGSYKKEIRTVNNGIILILVMLLAFMLWIFNYTVTTI